MLFHSIVTIRSGRTLSHKQEVEAWRSLASHYTLTTKALFRAHDPTQLNSTENVQNWEKLAKQLSRVELGRQSVQSAPLNSTS